MWNFLCCYNRPKPDDDECPEPEDERPIPISPVDLDSGFYNMKHDRRGLALIFCHSVYDKKLKLSKREGCEVDLKNLRRTFKILGFEEPIVCRDYTLAQMRRKLNEIQAMDFTDCDCLVVTIMTHGRRGNILMARDAHYWLDEEVCEKFTADRCPSLAQKPKIFFIQACKGKQKDPGQKLAIKEQHTVDSQASYTIATHADFLIFYSTCEKFVSYINLLRGSVFIDVLCDVLSTEYKEKGLMEMAQMVINRVNTQFESSHTDRLLKGGKQCPRTLSTLGRDVKFY